MCVTCVKVVVFSAGTAEASVSVLNRLTADEGTPSVKRTYVEERTSLEGIIRCSRLNLDRLIGIGVYSGMW